MGERKERGIRKRGREGETRRGRKLIEETEEATGVKEGGKMAKEGTRVHGTCARMPSGVEVQARYTVYAEIFIDFGCGNYAPQNEAPPSSCVSLATLEIYLYE